MTLRVLPFAALLAALLGAGPAAAAPVALTPPVAEEAARHPGRLVRVVVQERPGADATAAVVAAGGRIERRIRLIDALVVRVRAAGAARIAAAPDVRAVSLDARIRSANAGALATAADGLATAYNQSIRADRAWTAGVTGRGVGVAVIDSGIRGDLPDFRLSAGDATSRVVANAVVNPEATSAGDRYGHGTHIAGLIAGNGLNRAAGDRLRGRYVGVAPEARLIAIQASDDHGVATVLDVIDGLQFAVDHRRELGIRIVNLSLSSTVAESYRTDPLAAAAEAAWFHGLVVVTAAGNRGTAADAVSYAPGNDPYVISVGGVDDRGTKRLNDDVVAPWSSRGLTQDAVAKPDVLAPGAKLVSTVPAGSAYRRLCPACVVDAEYFRVGGTSMAAAVAAGAAALVLQAHPDWTPDQVKAALIADGRSLKRLLTDGPAGEIQVDKTVGRSVAPRPANGGLVASTVIDVATGGIDYTRTSWTRTGWTDAVDALRTSWTRTSWTRADLARTSWTASPAGCAELERTNWTRTSWTGADLASAREACDTLLAEVDPTRTSWTRTSWTRTSWTRTSWTSSFDK